MQPATSHTTAQAAARGLPEMTTIHFQTREKLKHIRGGGGILKNANTLSLLLSNILKQGNLLVAAYQDESRPELEGWRFI